MTVLLSWLNLEKLNNRFQEMLSEELHLHHHMRVSSWIRLNLNIRKPNNINHFRFRYIDDIFFIWTLGQEKLEGFLNNLKKFHPNLKFAQEYSRKNDTFLDLDVKILDRIIITDLFIQCHTLTILNGQ